MKIFVLNNGTTIGPLDIVSLDSAVRQGQVQTSALAWHEGREHWTDVMSLLRTSASPSEAASSNSDYQPRSWFYLGTRNETTGPISQAELLELMGKQVISPKTFVCTEGMPSWISAGDALKRFATPVISTTLPRMKDEMVRASLPLSIAELKKTGLLWPQSVLGSALFAVLVSYLSVRIAEKCGLVLATLQEPGVFEVIIAALLVLFHVLLATMTCGFILLLRYAVVAAPFRRKARLEGRQWKIQWFDRLVQNPRPYIVAGFATAVTMGAFLVLSQIQIANARDDIDQSERSARGLNSSAEDIEAQARSIAGFRRANEEAYENHRRNGFPTARESYLKAKAEIDQMEADLERKANSVVERGKSYFSDAVVSATTRESLKFVQIWTLIGILGGFTFAAYVSVQSRRAARSQ